MSQARLLSTGTLSGRSGFAFFFVRNTMIVITDHKVAVGGSGRSPDGIQLEIFNVGMKIYRTDFDILGVDGNFRF